MLEKYSQDAALRRHVRLGESLAQGMMKEALDLYKVSSVVDKDLPDALAKMVETFAHSAFFSSPELVAESGHSAGRLQKLSSTPRAFEEICARGETERLASTLSRMKVSAALREKRSFATDFLDGVFGSPDQDVRRRLMSTGRAPRTYGNPFNSSDPLFDFKRDLRELKEGTREAMRWSFLSPEQRIKNGVFLPGDENMIAKIFKPKPRTVREAILHGFHEGIREANETAPGAFGQARLDMLAWMAKRKGRSAQHRVNTGVFPGILGTIEDAIPTRADNIKETLRETGSKIRNMSPAAKAGVVGLGGLGLGIGAYKMMNRSIDGVRPKGGDIRINKQPVAPDIEMEDDQ